MKQQEQEKTSRTFRICTGLILLIMSAILVAGVYADTASESSAIVGSSAVSDSSAISRTSTYTNYYPFDSDISNASSITAFETSTSYVATPSSSDDSSGSSGDSTSQVDEVITESVLMLTKDQTAIQKINFKNSGTLVASSLSGEGFELYSKKADKYPQNVTSNSDYGNLSQVTSSAPVSLDIAAGSWYFTIFPIGDAGTYDIMAIQKSTSSQSSSNTGNSYTSVAESTPNTTRYSTTSITGNSFSSSEGFSTVGFR